MKFTGLTRRQAELLAYIRDCATRGETPSFQEMADATGQASKSGVHRLVEALIERGRLRRMPHKHRGIELVETNLLAQFTDDQLRAELAYRNACRRQGSRAASFPHGGSGEAPALSYGMGPGCFEGESNATEHAVGITA